jgi:hypothetical protein
MVSIGDVIFQVYFDQQPGPSRLQPKPHTPLSDGTAIIRNDTTQA